jgi:hypothetical protein
MHALVRSHQQRRVTKLTDLVDNDRLTVVVEGICVADRDAVGAPQTLKQRFSSTCPSYVLPGVRAELARW